MAQNLALISHGEPNWDIKVNAAIKRLNEVGGVTSSLQWTEFTDKGIVYQNGFANIAGPGEASTGYRYLVLGNMKIVELQVALHLNTDPGSSSSSLTALSVPDAITPDHAGTPHAQDDKYRINFLDGRVEISKLNSANNWWTGSGSYYLMHVMYTSKN